MTVDLRTCSNAALLRRLIGLAAGLGMAGLASNAMAQCPNYTMTQGTGTIVPGDTDVGNHADDLVTNVVLPFSFSLYGTPYTSVNLSSNGNLQFGTTGSFPAAYGNDCLPSPAQITSASIFPHWDDQRTDASGTGIFTSVSGAAPNRIFNIEWRTVYYENTALTANFEIRLYEGQARFDVLYGSMGESGSSATVGVQSGGAAFTQFECNTGGLNAGMLLTFDCPTTFGPSCTLSLTPAGGSSGSTFVAAAQVSPGGGPPSTGLAVSLDATGVNGGTVALLDNGVAPDTTAGDNIFSGNVTVGAGATLGSHTLTSTVSDAQARSSTCTAGFTVYPAGCNGEGEPCGINNPDTVNGGCNSTPNVYSTANFGTLYCGSGANSTSFRDTDWWMFTMPSGGDTVIVTATAAFAAQSFILAPTCPATILSPQHTNGSGGDLSYTFGPLTAGANYVFFVSPVGFDGSAVCGSNDSYSFTLQAGATGACCSDAGCSVMSNIACAAAGGHFNGPGTNCGTANYNITTSAGTFVDISGTGTMEPTTSGCDDCTANVALPFSFNFYGTAYTSVDISSNGNLQFGGAPSAAYTNDVIPSLNPPNNAIYPCWDDLYPIGGGDIFYQTDGAAPNRTFTVAWINVNQFGGGAPETFEAILYETSNNIEFRYGSMPADPGGDYTIGVENSDGTAANSINGTDIGTGNTARLLTFVGGSDPCGPRCGSADFNCDGDTGTDADIESFFACLAGTCPPPPCPNNADFNADGDTGTDADIESFFRVLAGGPC